MKNSIILLLFSISLFLQGSERFYFSNLSLADGLSQITVVSILQDKKGYMWFGTRNGLNRYDGYNFDVFITNTEDNTTISDNHILCLAEDKNGNLWVGTNNGLNRLDIATNKFKRFYSETGKSNTLSHNTVHTIFVDEDGKLWIGTEAGMDLYDPETESFRHILIGEKSIANRVNVISQKDNLFYIGTLSKGLIIYNFKTGEYHSYTTGTPQPFRLMSDQVKTVLIDKQENLWIGTQSGGISVLRKGDDKFTYYNQENGLTNNNVRSIAEAPDGNILIGTFNGLNVFDPQKDEITQYKEYGSKGGELSHYSVINVYFDRSQTLWIGTYAGGVCYYNRYGQKFHFFDPNLNRDGLLGLIGPAVETSSNLYIATEGGGLLEMDKQTGLFRNYVMFEGIDMTYGKNIIKSIYLNGGHILCGTTYGAVYSFDISTKRFTLIYNTKEQHSIYGLSKSKRGDLVLGAVSTYGFVMVSPSGHSRDIFPVKGGDEVYFSDVRCFLEIEENVFLIGTRNNGLYYYDYNTYTLKQYKNTPLENDPDAIPENFVTSIVKDKNGNIWVGTYGGGMSQLDLKRNKFTTYNTKNNLLSNNICTIVEDDNHHLWISTISGISDFDTETKAIKNYTHANGIKVDEFTLHSGLKLSNNDIIFSGNNGIVSFNPQRMIVNPNIPPVVLRSLSINNNLITPDDGTKVLQQRLDSQEEIILNYDQSNISIEYSALSYVFSERNQYAYKLEGFDKEWNNVGSRRMAYYTNIPPGEYRFVVRGSNNDGVWNDEGTSIKIVVRPPFWKTWWAYTFYILFVVGIISFIVRYFTEK